MYNQNRKKITIKCPKCKQPTKVKVIKGVTKLAQFPLWCENCKQETVMSYDGLSQVERPRAN